MAKYIKIDGIAQAIDFSSPGYVKDYKADQATVLCCVEIKGKVKIPKREGNQIGGEIVYEEKPIHTIVNIDMVYEIIDEDLGM